MPEQQEIQQIRVRIAEVFARREHMKQDLEAGRIPLRDGFARLEEVDQELSDLDSRFKRLWDAVRGHLDPP